MFPLGSPLVPYQLLPLQVFEPRYRRLVEDCRAGDERFGVVLFSDDAYEALPPGTPARELRPFVRFFAPHPRYQHDASGALRPRSPWDQSFSAGTSISSANHSRRPSLSSLAPITEMLAAGVRVGDGGREAIAHDTRVYDRSADMYLAALEKIQQQKEMISAEKTRSMDYAPPSPVPPMQTNIMARAFDSNLRARVIAFGSPSAVTVYGQLHKLANDLFNQENALRKKSKFGTQPYNSALAQALTDFGDREREFQGIVHDELS
jgi:hypothetical protein